MPRWSQDVYSSQAASITYDSDSQEMLVTYQTGKTYAYSGVPEDVAREAANAASVGQYLNENIKGSYRYRRVS